MKDKRSLFHGRIAVTKSPNPSHIVLVGLAKDFERCQPISGKGDESVLPTLEPSFDWGGLIGEVANGDRHDLGRRIGRIEHLRRLLTRDSHLGLKHLNDPVDVGPCGINGVEKQICEELDDEHNFILSDGRV